jgi:hypothetical protein
MDRQTLIEHLAQAERHASDGARQVAKQETSIAKLDRDGHDTTEALKMLATMSRNCGVTSSTTAAHEILYADAFERRALGPFCGIFELGWPDAGLTGPTAFQCGSSHRELNRQTLIDHFFN